MPERSSIEPTPARRRFLRRVVLGLGGAITAAISVPVIGFLLWPVRRRPVERSWRTVGALSEFAEGQTVKVTYRDPDALPWAGFAGTTAAYVRREGGERFVAFSAYCTHTGCPVKWVPGARLFLCPCHGGSFHRDGTVAGGPPPRPLEQHEVRVRQGMVEIRSRQLPVG